MICVNTQEEKPVHGFFQLGGVHCFQSDRRRRRRRRQCLQRRLGSKRRRSLPPTPPQVTALCFCYLTIFFSFFFWSPQAPQVKPLSWSPAMDVDRLFKKSIKRDTKPAGQHPTSPRRSFSFFLVQMNQMGKDPACVSRLNRRSVL